MSGVLVFISQDHPAFPGHFPGQPLLPGVSLLAEVIEAIRANQVPPNEGGSVPEPGALVVPVVKFLHPVRPGDTLRIEWAPKGSRLAFEVWVLPAASPQVDPAEQVLAASGQLEWRP